MNAQTIIEQFFHLVLYGLGIGFILHLTFFLFDYGVSLISKFKDID